MVVKFKLLFYKVFIQKFQDDPDAKNVLTDRKNLIVLTDEAHRTQYSVFAGNVRQALPHASFLGVTGTPISQNDKDTFNVFGPIVSSYKIGQAVADGATVPIYYEGRLVPLHLADKFVDSKLDDILGEIVVDEKARARKEWAVLEEVVGSQSRIEKIAKDIVFHFNNRPINGKAMIVCMSRRKWSICSGNCSAISCSNSEKSLLNRSRLPGKITSEPNCGQSAKSSHLSRSCLSSLLSGPVLVPGLA